MLVISLKKIASCENIENKTKKQRVGAKEFEKSAILLLKIDFFRNSNRHVYVLDCPTFNMFLQFQDPYRAN